MSRGAKNLGGTIMKNLIVAMALAVLIAWTGVVQAREQARMSAAQIQQATISTQGSLPAGSVGPEIIIWMMLAIIFITAIATSGGSGVMGYGYGSGPMLSDQRVKTDIRRVGTSDQGFGIYEFRYKGFTQRIRGVMAQDVADLRPGAVSRHASGYLMVDYSKVDVVPALID